MADILIIDDEADIRDLVSGILEDDGHQVRAARDSEAEKGQPGRPLRRKEGAHDQTLSLPSPKPRIAAQLGAVHEKSTS